MIRILLLLCFSFSIGFSQNVKGKIVSDSLPIANVEVINVSSKEVVKADKDGRFEIKASVGNWLTFYHKKYDVTKIYVDSLFDYNKSLEIVLVLKTEKIEEILVTNMGSFFGNVKPDGTPLKPVTNFSDGTVYTGMDLKAIGKMIFGIFKNKDKPVRKEKEPIEFRLFAEISYDYDFLAKSLQLKSDEVSSFLDFCGFDPDSKKAVENSDKLELLQFLLRKSEEYKKIYRRE